jgi:SAM-dependent methyltransferase
VLDSLHRRPRTRRLAARLGWGSRVVMTLEQRRPVAYEDVLEAPSCELRGRLDAADVAEVVRRLDPDERVVWDGDAEPGRARLALTYGTHYRVPAVLEKTGLTPAVPPASVHAMTRGAMTAGGDPWLADFIAGAVRRAGREIPAGGAALDFGCSSARVLRMLAAWRSDVRWIGCDPNAGAIDWARANLPGLELFTSPQRPPLPLPDGTLDLVYAISIWSHFAAGAGLRWIEEMRRALKPGGLLLLTTHGLTSIGDFVRRNMLRRRDAARFAHALLRGEHAFQPRFGSGGDWGVVDPEWGMGYMTPEWLLPRVRAGWTPLLYEPGRLQANQDLYVLERGQTP